jgi:WD40 repeat protein
MSSRLFIAAGTAQYDHLAENMQRPALRDVVRNVTELFTAQLGYAQALPEISHDPTSHELRKRLDAWLGSKDRDRSDWVVFYYTGHGELVGTDALYLLTKDFESGFHTSTAFPVAQLGDMLNGRRAGGANRRVRRFLLILDTCHSGAGVFELSKKLSSLFFQGLTDGMFYVLAAAFPNEEAMSGALANALITSLQDDALGGTQQPYIYFDQLVPAINRRLRESRIVYAPVTSPDEEPQFFPNPRHVKGLPVSPTVAEIRSAVERGELQAFWGPVSRGVELEQQTGWYFTGREKILDDLSQWLNDPHDAATRIVTGKAGSGKSTILSRIVTTSDPEYRSSMPLAERQRSRDFAPGTLDLAIHARGKTVDEVTGRMAAALGVEDDRTKVFDALRRRPAPFRVVLDALDEAREPARIAQELLMPMSSISTAKVLVGTRPEYVPDLGSDALALHVDEPGYFNKQDLIDYVEARLLCRDDCAARTPYRDQVEPAAGVARVVAEKAAPNFLIARLIAEDLLSLPEALGAEGVEARGIPSTVEHAFEKYLAGFGDEEQKARDLLAPLAWAGGRGLPWDHVWAPLAGALSGRVYENDDVAWVLRRAGSFIVESLEQNRSVYRLYHQALADYLRQGRNDAETEVLVARTLAATVPPLGDVAKRDWQLASPYVRAHLAEHAAAGGLLDENLADPLFLLTADVGRLLSVLSTHGQALSRDVLHVYKSVVHHIRDKSIGEAASYLKAAALKQGLTDLAGHASLSVLQRDWDALWARWHRESTSHAIGNGEQPITALAAATWNSRPVAVLGRKDGAVEVWDLADGDRLARWLPEGVDQAREVALTETEEGPVLIAAWSGGRLGAHNVSTGTSVVRPKESRVLALCVVSVEGGAACVTAHENLDLVLWKLPALEPVVTRPAATTGSIYGLFEIQRDGETVLLSTGDSLELNRDARTDSTLRLWSLPELTPLWGDGREGQGVLCYADSGHYFGRHLVAVSQDAWGPPEIWDLDSRRVLYQDTEASNYAWFHPFRGETLLISQGLSRLRVQRLTAAGDGADLSLTAEPAADDIPIHGDKFTRSDLHGRKVLLSTSLDHVRVWDIDELLSNRGEGSEQQDPPRGVSSLAVAAPDAASVCIGTYEEVERVDASTGAVIWRLPLPNARRIQSLAMSPDGRSLIAGTGSGRLYAIDVQNGVLVQPPLEAGKEVCAICAVSLKDIPLLVATVDGGRRSWKVRLWDLTLWEEIDTAGGFGLLGGQGDKRLFGLAALQVGGSLRIAFASKYSKVMIGDWNFDRPRELKFQEWQIPGADAEYVNCLALGRLHFNPLLAAGTEYGRLALWNFLEDTERRALSEVHHKAHLLDLKAMYFHRIAGRDVLATGGNDGIIRFWTSELEPLEHIEIEAPITALAWPAPHLLAVGTVRGTLMLNIGGALFDKSTDDGA